MSRKDKTKACALVERELYKFVEMSRCYLLLMLIVRELCKCVVMSRCYLLPMLIVREFDSGGGFGGGNINVNGGSGGGTAIEDIAATTTISIAVPELLVGNILGRNVR